MDGRRIEFILNDRELSIESLPGELVLDVLRDQLQLSGTKEGCREGDCGACAILVGSLTDEGIRYEVMTSCLMPVIELEGKHVVTIEGLSSGELSTVQAFMVATGGAQCGYCTPGFVVSLTGWLLNEELTLDSKGFCQAISGNLCRCTGYQSIRQAGTRIAEALTELVQSENRIATLCERSDLPAYFRDIESRLRKKAENKNTQRGEGQGKAFMAGGTDLYIQKGYSLPRQSIQFLNEKTPAPGQAKIVDGWIQVEARMSFEAFGRDAVIQEAIPDILEYNELVASLPIRNRATIGGNLCNASPIGDLTCLLLALGSEIALSGPKGSRHVPLCEYYLGYKSLNKDANEVLETIRFPQPSKDSFINWEKVSRRRNLDIASVNSACLVEVRSQKIDKARVSIGGVAPIPMRLRKLEDFLTGKSISVEMVLEAVLLAQSEISPISDSRGSADYKRLLARQLLIAHFLKGFPDVMDEEEVYAALR